MAALLAISVSASLARRRSRPNQAKLRSTTQRRQENEASGRVGALDDGQLEPLVAGRGGRDLALIAAVGEDQGEKGKRRRMRVSSAASPSRPGRWRQ